MEVRFAESEQCRIAYTEAGSAPQTLVFIHGYRMVGSLWNDVDSSVPKEKYRRIKIDLRGSGASDKPVSGYSIEDYSKDVRAVLSHAEVESAILIGHSMGGVITQYLMSHDPQGVAAAVLAAPVPASGMKLTGDVLNVFRQSISDHTISRALYEGSVVGGNDVVDRLLDMASTTCREAAIESLDTWRLANFAAATEGINLPTLVLAGERDGLFTENLLRDEVVRRLPNSQLKVVPMAGHFLPVEQPTVVAKLIDQFVTEMVHPRPGGY